MIRFEKVTKRYVSREARKTIVQDLSMVLPTDRNLAIIGRNGAGKSTLLRMISGAILPDSGRIVRTNRVSWQLGLSAGVNGSMTGEQNCRFLARLYGEDSDRLIDFVKDFAELGPSIRLPVSTYSSGMRARLTFALSMGIDFDVYLIDELTAVGDAAFRKKCTAVFAEKIGRAHVIMVSHSMGSLRNLCQSGIVLENGKLHYHEDVKDAISYYENLIGIDSTEG
ncbi:MAG TPA: ABC transporter ATP-binding protein [Hyphomicrobiales bacterium]|nr:ABC transporter ATP-binding protein [Hyphomicrobiales bacterium]